VLTLKQKVNVCKPLLYGVMVRHNTEAIADVPVIYTVVAGASDYTQFIASGVDVTTSAFVGSAAHTFTITPVGRCRLTVSKPVLKPPMVSALESII